MHTQLEIPWGKEQLRRRRSYLQAKKKMHYFQVEEVEEAPCTQQLSSFLGSKFQLHFVLVEHANLVCPKAWQRLQGGELRDETNTVS